LTLSENGGVNTGPVAVHAPHVSYFIILKEPKEPLSLNSMVLIAADTPSTRFLMPIHWLFVPVSRVNFMPLQPEPWDVPAPHVPPEEELEAVVEPVEPVLPVVMGPVV